MSLPNELNLFGGNSLFTQEVAQFILANVSKLVIRQASCQFRAVTGVVNSTSIYWVEQVKIMMNKNILGLDGISLKPRYQFR